MSSNIKEDILKKYAHAFKTLEENIKSYNKKDNKFKGYLINLNDYNELKKNIDYEKYKNSFLKNWDISDNEKKFTIKELELKTHQNLINMLLNRNKYIIVDPSFHKVICEKGNTYKVSAEYSITDNTNYLNLVLEDKISIKFKNNKNNIIEESNLNSRNNNNNFDEIKKAHKSVKNYYDFEIIIEKGLNAKQSEKIIGEGYLIEKDWIDKWKKKINYDKIKKDFLIPNKSEKEIRDNIIDIFDKDKIKYMDLVDIKDNEFSKKLKVLEFLKNNSLVLVSSNFISSLSNTISKGINYSIYENTIKINFGSTEYLCFNSKDNTISLNSNIKENENTIEKKIDKSDNDGKNENNMNSQDNKFGIDILTILLNLNLGEKDFLDKSESSKKEINQSMNSYYLIKSSFLSQSKEFFLFDKEISKLIEEYKINDIDDIDKKFNKIKIEKKDYFEKLSSRKNDFLKKFSGIKFFEVDKKSKTETTHNIIFIYPVEFEIIKKELGDKLFDLLGNKDNDNIDEILLGFNSGNIIFRPTKGQFFDENKCYVYIYALSKELKENIKFYPEVAFIFGNKMALFNKFNKLIRDETLIEECSKNNIIHINTKYQCKGLLIYKTKSNLYVKPTNDSKEQKVDNNTNEQTKLNNNNTENNEKEEKINKYLSYSIELYNEYSTYNLQIEKPNNKMENECYLVNKNLIVEIEDILCYNDINETLIKNKEVIKNYSMKKENKDILEKIKKEINTDTIKKINELEDKKFEELLKQKENILLGLSKSYIGEKSKNVFYFKDCKIINKKILELLKKIINNPIDKVKNQKCIYDKGNIIILIKEGQDEVINVGNFEKSNNNFLIKYVIQKTKNNTKLSEIFGMFKNFGIDYISNKISSGKINYSFQETQIYPISNQNNISKINDNVSNKKSNDNNNVYKKQNISHSTNFTDKKNENVNNINNNKNKALSQSIKMDSNQGSNTNTLD